MTILEDTRVITGGVDTHADMHVAAALDPLGGLLGVREFPATAAGYADLLSWLTGFGNLALVGVEGTGSYGAGLARHLAAARVRVVEVDRADRQGRVIRVDSQLPEHHDPTLYPAPASPRLGWQVLGEAYVSCRSGRLGRLARVTSSSA
jgi:transposase